MKPVSPDSDNDHSQSPENSQPENSQPENSTEPASGAGVNSAGVSSAGVSSAETSGAGVSGAEASGAAATEHPDAKIAGPLVNLQRRYTDQLSQDIEQLEAEKSRLQAEIAALRQDYVQLQSETRSLRHTASLSVRSPASAPPRQSEGPRLPGETEVPPPPLVVSGPAGTPSTNASSQERSLELPTPATSEQRRQIVIQRQRRIEPIVKAANQRGLILSAIATVLTACHYGLVSSLHQGGSWFGLEIGALGTGFVPAVALLWLRMLVMVPGLVLLAPQLHRDTWEDLQAWFYTDERRFIPLVGSGVALFFSQVLLYQCLGTVGAVVGVALLFLYPLSAIPLGLGLKQARSLTPFGLLAGVAIAMGGLLVAKPALTAFAPTAVWSGLLASVFLGLYIVLTNFSYRQQCHPIPTAVVQFSTVAVLSSVVLLVKPLKLVSISWLSLSLWGLLIGALMLVAYLFTYSSLRLINTKTAMVAATTPIVTLLLSWGLTPRVPLEIIQWTGILLVSIGGIALAKEKLTQEKLAKGRQPD